MAAEPETTEQTRLDYLRDRIWAVARGKPVRDLDEAFEAVRVEIEQLLRENERLHARVAELRASARQNGEAVNILAQHGKWSSDA